MYEKLIGSHTINCDKTCASSSKCFNTRAYTNVMKLDSRNTHLHDLARQLANRFIIQYS